jgi:hypothetical protein
MKIKNCFFCDGKSKLCKAGDGYYIKCLKCGFQLAGFDTKKEVRLEWDRMERTADHRSKKT